MDMLHCQWVLVWERGTHTFNLKLSPVVSAFWATQWRSAWRCLLLQRKSFMFSQHLPWFSPGSPNFVPQSNNMHVRWNGNSVLTPKLNSGLSPCGPEMNWLLVRDGFAPWLLWQTPAEEGRMKNRLILFIYFTVTTCFLVFRFTWRQLTILNKTGHTNWGLSVLTRDITTDKDSPFSILQIESEDISCMDNIYATSQKIIVG